MKRLALFYENQTTIVQNILSAIPTATVFYFAAFLSTWIAQIASESDSTLRIAIHSITFIFVATIVLFLVDRFNAERKAIYLQEEIERNTLASAHAHCDRVTSHIIGKVKVSNSVDDFVETYLGSLQVINEYVKATYLTYEDSYGNGSDPMKRINFEVTFMTKSYQDNNITIPICANRDNRQPRSMVLRKSNPKIYENTETAKIYRAERPEPIMVQDTSQSDRYTELYHGQLERIRSSIIYPILSDRNELLGTLVVHCDRPGFFDPSRRKYWFELLEIFAKNIAVEKIKLDVFSSMTGEMKISFPIKFSF